jgi:hypothetical protein
MKLKAYTCDCCGFADFGQPFTKDLPVTIWHRGIRLDRIYSDVCEGCAILLGKSTEAALNIIQKQADTPRDEYH